MPDINILAIIVAGLIPNIVGALFYGPLFGNMWRSALGKSEEELAPANPAVAYGGAFILSIILAFFLHLTIQLVHKGLNDTGELAINSHFTFGHGALHGALVGLTILTPVIISLGIFHKVHWKANILNANFWILCLALMGGILDVWQ